MGDRQYTTCRITYAVPEPTDEDLYGSGDDWVRLEQPEWQTPPEGGLFAWLKEQNLELTLANVTEYAAQYASQCQDDGVLEVEIFVYKSRPDLAYTISASYGDLGEATQDVADKTEYANIGMEDSYTLDTVPGDNLAATWEGPVYATDGSVVTPPPTIAADGQQLSWGGIRVLGTIKLQYSANREVRILTITPREGEDVDREDPSTAYASTVTAFWGDGEYTQLDVDLPDLSGNCGGDRSSIDDDDEDEECFRHVIYADPCTKEVLDEWDEPMPCPAAEEEAPAEEE